ncbi:MAG: hypothetical protein GYB25_11340 [Rhodobacteraceae bacterium]|nr:hypothetical protein [Paracoccaceae bacterium]
MSKKAETLRVMILAIAIGVGFVVQVAAEHGCDALQFSAAPEVQVEMLPVL